MDADLIELGRRRPLVGPLGAVRTLPDASPLEDERTLLRATMRTATTDHARTWFRRCWTPGAGSGAHVPAHGLLDLVREDAEGGGASGACR